MARDIDQIIGETVEGVHALVAHLGERDQEFINYVEVLNQLLVESNEVMKSTNTRIDRLERRLERLEGKRPGPGLADHLDDLNDRIAKLEEQLP